MATKDALDREAFTEALAKRMDASGRSMTGLAVDIAQEEGRAEPYSQAHISDWKGGRRLPGPHQVFAIERVLGAPPGSLSRLLGYLPTSARTVTGVVDAVRADPSLSPQHQDAIVALYRALSAPGKER